MIRFSSDKDKVCAYCSACTAEEECPHEQWTDPATGKLMAAGLMSALEKRKWALKQLANNCIFPAEECPADALLKGKQLENQDSETAEIQPQ